MREQLRNFLIRLGYDPVMSEYSDVLYDPRAHTHSSCIQEIPNSDLLVVIIGRRFGGKVIPEALSDIDLDNLMKSSYDVSVLSDPEKLSITQLEVLKAVDKGIPVFAFVDSRVMHDHHVYQKNKTISEKINFPSLEKPESAKYIFEFINFLSHRNKGNSVVSFSKTEDIEVHLRKQWSSYFQRLLREKREKNTETRKIYTISEQIEDLKTAIISTVGNTQNREVARGVIRYRRLSDFLSGLNLDDPSLVTQQEVPFEDLLSKANIASIRDIPSAARNHFGRTALIKSDGTFYELRYNKDILSRIAVDWQSFISLSGEIRQVIFDAIAEMGRMGPGLLRHRRENFEEYFKDELIEEPSGNEDFDMEEFEKFLKTITEEEETEG